MKKSQAEALALLAEECGEAIQMIGKCLRHGLDAVNPLDDSEEPPLNRTDLAQELGHVVLAIDLAIEQGIVTKEAIIHSSSQKRGRIGRWLHHFHPKPKKEEAL